MKIDEIITQLEEPNSKMGEGIIVLSLSKGKFSGCLYGSLTSLSYVIDCAKENKEFNTALEISATGPKEEHGEVTRKIKKTL